MEAQQNIQYYISESTKMLLYLYFFGFSSSLSYYYIFKYKYRFKNPMNKKRQMI
jgi:hypothetical protein